jgi:hypothetical protein
LETRICIEIGGAHIIDRARHFAKANGYVHVNPVAIPEHVVHWELDILHLVSNTKQHDFCYSWENLVGKLKSAGTSLEALEKGKSVPYKVMEQAQPG